MKLPKLKRKMIWAWCRSRYLLLLYVLIIFIFFFVMYALYGYEWGVAGYAALLSFVLGIIFAFFDIISFAYRCTYLHEVIGKFPTSPLPHAQNLLEQRYSEVICGLERERLRLEQENEISRRDAQEYYTLWAHQIKTPLAAMRLLLQSGNGVQNNTLAATEQELFRIEQYVEMVLQYQRLSSIQNDLDFQKHSLERLVKKAAKNCAPLFIYKKLRFEPGALSQSIVTDEKWFCFVLEQLYSNAIKYTENGGIKVYLQEPDVLVVEDTGCGISASDLPRVFERGFTGTVGRSERSSTGIGLYLCKLVMERLGFGICVESKVGEGTRVLLQLMQHQYDVE